MFYLHLVPVQAVCSPASFLRYLHYIRNTPCFTLSSLKLSMNVKWALSTTVQNFSKFWAAWFVSQGLFWKLVDVYIIKSISRWCKSGSSSLLSLSWRCTWLCTFNLQEILECAHLKLTVGGQSKHKHTFAVYWSHASCWCLLRLTLCTIYST